MNGNTAIGNQGQGVNFSGAFNTSIGGASLIQTISGSNNTGLGQATLQNLTDTVASLGAIVPGSGYTDGTYTNVNLTTDHIYGFTAGNLTADIVVSGGAVTGVTIVLGRGVRVTSILTILASTAPAGLLTGAGFSVPVATVNVPSITAPFAVTNNWSFNVVTPFTSKLVLRVVAPVLTNVPDTV